MWIRAKATFSNRRYLNHCPGRMLQNGQVTQVHQSYGREITNTALAEQISEPAPEDTVVGVDDPSPSDTGGSDTTDDDTTAQTEGSTDTANEDVSDEYDDTRSLDEVDIPHAELLAERELVTVADLVRFLEQDGDLTDIPRIGSGRSSNIKEALAHL
jgi:hypothetical protein